jgi:hypothetical protein
MLAEVPVAQGNVKFVGVTAKTFVMERSISPFEEIVEIQAVEMMDDFIQLDKVKIFTAGF